MRAMASYGPSTYGDRIADFYDEFIGLVFPSATTEQAVCFLAELAGGGPALELGIGTGRIALPLAEHGVAVTGIDASEAMLARLRSRPGGDRVLVVPGDFGELALDGRFRVVYVAFNTFFALLTQDAQVRCFRRVAEHLTDEGVFVIEAFVPDPTLYTRGQRLSARHIEPGRLLVDAGRYDPVTQRVSALNVVIEETGIRLYPVELRYAWPTELDLMAELAGLRLRERFGNWQREPFGAASASHVSVYARP
jgi:SAM-dependent methyltransferase